MNEDLNDNLEPLSRLPRAYRDVGFMDTTEARPIRILAEYLHPMQHFKEHQVHDTIVFFGSARIFEASPMGRYYRDARHLAQRLTRWSDGLGSSTRRFVVASGGGPGIMEAANRGAVEAGGKTVGLNIGLPMEQRPNPFVTPELNFEFHYFFMRKFWFAYLAKALVVFPGGFGTLDEMSELLTLTQTQKLHKKLVTVFYGTSFWKEVINFDALVKHGMISESDLGLFQFADDVDSAYNILTQGLTDLYLGKEGQAPDIPHVVD